MNNSHATKDWQQIVVKNFIKDTKATTAIEYGMIAALIAVVIISSAIGMSGALNNYLMMIVNVFL